jgi:hypothetical protein
MNNIFKELSWVGEVKAPMFILNNGKGRLCFRLTAWHTCSTQGIVEQAEEIFSQLRKIVRVKARISQPRSK